MSLSVPHYHEDTYVLTEQTLMINAFITHLLKGEKVTELSETHLFKMHFIK